MTWSKRVFDLCLAALLLLPALPVLLGLAILIRLRDGAPVFYLSERMRSADEGFTLIKFRTMKVDPSRSGVTGGDKANAITPLGHWLRKTRLDELPQLWNVLRGDISFVGPRPPLRRYVEEAPELYRRVLASRPGVTGLATLRYHRHETIILDSCGSAAETHAVYLRRCVPRKAAIDLIYQRHSTVCLDLSIILHTVWAVLPRHRQKATRFKG